MVTNNTDGDAIDPARITDRTTTDSISVQDNGIRLPHCPSCERPIMLPYGLSTGKFGQCPWEDCSAWLAHEVEVTSLAFDSREEAKRYHEEGTE